MDTHRSRQWRSRRQTLILIVGLALCVAGLLWPNWRRLRTLEARTTAMDADIARLEEHIAQLTTEREKLLSDPTYVERVARQEFHATRQGEILFKIQQPATSSQPPAAAQEH